MSNNIILVGFMGAGKSSIGTILSKTLHYTFLDTDTLIEKEEKKSISSIFKEDGEAYFRRCEVNLCKTFSDINNTVISTGGGFSVNREVQSTLYRYGQIFYLNASLNTLLSRIQTSKSRPLNNENLELLYKTRLPLYESISDHTVYVDELSVQDIASRILRVINKDMT